MKLQPLDIAIFVTYGGVISTRAVDLARGERC